jgi:hypothetical protein
LNLVKHILGLPFRVLPDESRKNGKVKRYKLPPEELEKYGVIDKGAKQAPSISSIAEAIEKRKAAGQHIGGISKMTKEQLIEEIKLGGLNNDNYKRIAEKYGYQSYQTIRNKASNMIRLRELVM